MKPKKKMKATAPMPDIKDALIWALAVPSMSPPPRNFWMPFLTNAITTLKAQSSSIPAADLTKIMFWIDNNQNGASGNLNSLYSGAISDIYTKLFTGGNGLWITLTSLYAGLINSWLGDVANHYDSIQYTIPNMVAQAKTLPQIKPLLNTISSQMSNDPRNWSAQIIAKVQVDMSNIVKQLGPSSTGLEEAA